MFVDFVDTVYNMLIGEHTPMIGDPIVENMFAEGRTCEQLYNDVYEANLRICQRLNTQEDADVELIINSLLRISKILSTKMFDYGVKYQAGQLHVKSQL